MKDYSENHVSRNTLMTPNDAGKKENQTEVKTQLESVKKTDNPQPRIEAGDKVRVVVKNKFEKGYTPDWSDEVYTVQSVSKGKTTRLSLIYYRTGLKLNARQCTDSEIQTTL